MRKADQEEYKTRQERKKDKGRQIKERKAEEKKNNKRLAKAGKNINAQKSKKKK